MSRNKYLNKNVYQHKSLLQSFIDETTNLKQLFRSSRNVFLKHQDRNEKFVEHEWSDRWPENLVSYSSSKMLSCHTQVSMAQSRSKNWISKSRVNVIHQRSTDKKTRGKVNWSKNDWSNLAQEEKNKNKKTKKTNLTSNLPLSKVFHPLAFWKPKNFTLKI